MRCSGPADCRDPNFDQGLVAFIARPKYQWCQVVTRWQDEKVDPIETRSVFVDTSSTFLYVNFPAIAVLSNQNTDCRRKPMRYAHANGYKA